MRISRSPAAKVAAPSSKRAVSQATDNAFDRRTGIAQGSPADKVLDRAIVTK